MIVNFSIRDFPESFASIYVDSKIFSGEQYECHDDTRTVSVKAIENKLLYNMGAANIIKTLLSLFAYGEGDYYAPYRRVYECAVDPKTNPFVIIEIIKGEIVFKDNDGKTLSSTKTEEISKKKIRQYIGLSIFRLIYVLSVILYATVKVMDIPVFRRSVWFYIGLVLVAGAVVYTVYDVLSVWLRANRYYRKYNHEREKA